MARVTGAEVKLIMKTKLTATEIEPFIMAANLLTTRECSAITDDDLLKEIEKYLTAHNAAISASKTSIRTEQQIDVLKEKYSGKYGAGLNATPYGQMAMALDSTNSLAALDPGMVTPEIYTIQWSQTYTD